MKISWIEILAMSFYCKEWFKTSIMFTNPLHQTIWHLINFTIFCSLSGWINLNSRIRHSSVCPCKYRIDQIAINVEQKLIWTWKSLFYFYDILRRRQFLAFNARGILLENFRYETMKSKCWCRPSGIEPPSPSSACEAETILLTYQDNKLCQNGECMSFDC